MTAPKHPDMVQWEEIVSQWYPHLHDRAYFVPSVHMNQLFYDSKEVAGQTVSLPHPPVTTKGSKDPHVLVSDVQDDRATQHVLHCLQALARHQREGGEPKVMFVLSQLKFCHYLSEDSYEAATRLLPKPLDLKVANSRSHEGEWDLVFIHKRYGVVVGETKSVGVAFGATPQAKRDAAVVKRVTKAINQLDKEERILAHVLSDLQHPPKIRKTLLLPYIRRSELRRIMGENSTLQQAMLRCLTAHGSTLDPADLCLCADDVSDPATPHQVTDDVMTRLLTWWDNLMTSAGPDKDFTEYLQVVARFAGPATTMHVFCVSEPRVHLHTEGEAASETATRFTRIVLHPQQVDLLHHSPPLLFVSGPPGTGKTLVLILKAVMWLLEGHEVHIISTGSYSLAMSHRMELQVRKMAGSPAEHRLHLHVIPEADAVTSLAEELGKAVDSEGRLFVVVDEAADNPSNRNFSALFAALQGKVRGLHLWAADCYRQEIPAGLTEVALREPLRSPPVIVREVKRSDYFVRYAGSYHEYMDGPAPLPTDGPAVRCVHHTGEGHEESVDPLDCETCGADLARVLCQDLGVGQTAPVVTSSTANPKPLRYQDVLILTENDSLQDASPPEDADPSHPATASGIVRGLRQAGVPVQVVKKGDVTAAKELAVKSGPDMVLAADGDVITGLEKKVVVLVGRGLAAQDDQDLPDGRFYLISRCTGQLIKVLLPNDTRHQSPPT